MCEERFGLRVGDVVFPDPYKRGCELRQRQERIHEETDAIRRRNAKRTVRIGLLVLLAFVLIRCALYYVNLIGSGLREMKFDSTATRVAFEAPPRGSLFQIIDSENRKSKSRTSLGRKWLKKHKTITETDWINLMLDGFGVWERDGKLVIHISKRRAMQCRVTTQSQGRRYVVGWIDHRPRELPFWKVIWNVGIHGDPGIYSPDFELPSDGNFVWECRGQDGSYARMRWARN